jgi:hypothetical protein
VKFTNREFSEQKELFWRHFENSEHKIFRFV